MTKIAATVAVRAAAATEATITTTATTTFRLRVPRAAADFENRSTSHLARLEAGFFWPRLTLRLPLQLPFPLPFPLPSRSRSAAAVLRLRR